MSRVTGNPSRRIDALRRIGARGGRIAPHRAMIGLEVSRWLLIDLIVLPLIFAVAVFVLLDPMMEMWQAIFRFVREPLGLPGTVATRVTDLLPIISVPVPYFTAESAWPSTFQLVVGWILTLILGVLGVVLRGKATPLGYLVRGIAIVQLSAQVWFTLSAPPFAYGLPSYMSGLLLVGVVILMLSPFLVGITFFIFDFPLWQKALLASMLLVHLAIMIPLQAAVHAWVIHRASLLAMPVLFFVFGVLLDVFIYVALYGWGMSWRSGGALDWSDRRIPPADPAIEARTT